MRKKTADTYSREEGQRIAQELFGFMGKVRLYNSDARAVAIRIIEHEMSTESEPVEHAFFAAAVEMIKKIEADQQAAHTAVYARGSGAPERN